MKPKKPFIPAERHETVRRQMMSLLEGNILSARDISVEVGIPEKEVYEHLEHIHRSADREGGHLIVKPAECRECGFLFRKRDRLKKPGKCPVCHSESITEPMFTIGE